MKKNKSEAIVFLSIVVISLVLLSSLTGCAEQQQQPAQPEYPTKPITLICPWAAEGELIELRG